MQQLVIFHAKNKGNGEPRAKLWSKGKKKKLEL